MRLTQARQRLAVALLATASLTGMVMAGAVPAAASSASALASPPPAHLKPVPVRPPSSPGVATGTAIPAKPHITHRNVSPNSPTTGWTVTLTASPSILWPTQYTTLTATANMDVGPTPYYLRIYDGTTNTYVATCGSGTTCSIPITEPTASYQAYTAVVSDDSASYPPGSEQAVSALVAVVWQAIYLSLAASPTTVPVGSASTLTATTSTDVGPTPFYTEIFDATAGTLLASCGFGTSCTATVSQAAAQTDQYIAYVSASSSAFPPSGLQSTSQAGWVTWSDSGWQVSLSGPAETFGGAATYTATVNGDVGPTPFWIEVFDETTGALLGRCGSGGSCAVSFVPRSGGDNLVAFVSSASSTLPPSAIQASSNVLFTRYQVIP